MLSSKLLETIDLNDISLPTIKEIYRAVIRYSAGQIKSYELKRIARSHGLTSKIKTIKKGFLDSNHYMLSVFWRGLCGYAKSCNKLGAVAEHGITCDDIDIAREFLLEEDFTELKNRHIGEHLTEKEKCCVLNEVLPYINRIVKRKLSFIAKYDSALGTADLIGELVAEAIRIIHIYDQLEREKLLNYVRRSVHNATMNIIGSKTTKSRQRIVKTADESGDSLTEFKSILYSLDGLSSFYDCDNECEMYDFIKDDKPSQLDHVEQDNMMETIGGKLSDNEMKFVRIISGEHNKEFEKWVIENGEEITDLSLSRLTKNAYLFTGADKKSLRTKLLRSDYFKHKKEIYG